MAAVFVSMVVTAGVGFGAASALAAYAQRNWKGRGVRTVSGQTEV